MDSDKSNNDNYHVIKNKVQMEKYYLIPWNNCIPEQSKVFLEFYSKIITFTP